MKNLRFGQLCTDDKLRLQALITELANANQNLKAKEKRIDELELQLNEKENLVNEVNSQKSDSDDKAKRTKYALEKFRNEISIQQNTIEKQINDAMEQITRIKEKRKFEAKQFKTKEKELRQQIDYHIETARSTENNRERIESELNQLKQKTPNNEISIQTSFIEESSWQEKLRAEQIKLENIIQEQGQLLNKAVGNLEKLENQNLDKSTKSDNTEYKALPTPRSVVTQTTDTISTLPSNLAKLIADIEYEQLEQKTDQSMTRLVDLIDELELDTVVNDGTTSDVSSIQNDIIFEPELEDLFFQ